MAKTLHQNQLVILQFLKLIFCSKQINEHNLSQCFVFRVVLTSRVNPFISIALEK
jgi:hypothetical protein